MRNEIDKYLAAGLSLIPCKLDKSPNVSGTWMKDFSPDELAASPAIGVKCGAASGGLECIDVDNHTGTAKENLSTLIEQIKDLYEKHKFPIERSKNGGFHLLFRSEAFEGNKKLAQVPVWDEPGKRFKPDPIFETRGEGGYFCAYPSPGYTVIRNNIFEIPTITREERAELMNTCRSFNTWVEPIRTDFEQKDKPGDIYNQSGGVLQDVKSLLTSSGWQEFSNGWRRPGKKEGISATLGKAADNIFYVFSSSAYPFEPMKGYTPFQVLALIKYGGDFKACAKDLADKFDMKPQRTSPGQSAKVEKTPDERMARLNRAYIDHSKPIERPPVILHIADGDEFNTVNKRVFTLGNFSAIIGKAKSRKTFNLTMLTAAMIKRGNVYNKFFAQLPPGREQVLYFDTEQGIYDSGNVIKRMERLAEVPLDYFAAFNIREYSPKDRCEIIEDALNAFKGVGFLAIDGIADLATAINDEDEATRVTGLLLRWTKEFNCHICTIIHQNKNDNFATGHLGSSVMKKAEIVISVSKEVADKNVSLVSCDFSRGIDFEDYRFAIDGDGLPYLTSPVNVPKKIPEYYERYDM